MPRFIFRITHAENVPRYLEEGLIRAKGIPPTQFGYRVSDQNIISRRGDSISTRIGFPVNNYVPFYFSPLTTMAMSIAYGNVPVLDPRGREIGDSSSDQMAFIVAQVDLVANHCNYKFTSAACNTAIPPAVYDDISLLEQAVNWGLFDDGAIKGAIPEINYPGSTRFCSDSDKSVRYHNRKKERMAEFMVHREFPMELTCAIVTSNRAARVSLEAEALRLGYTINVLHKPDCFF